jgi:hypothetical protein
MQLKAIRSAIEDNNATCSVFYSRLAPSHFFEVKQPSQRLPLNVLNDKIVLCVSAIGCPNAFIHTAREVPFFILLVFPSIVQNLLALHILCCNPVCGGNTICTVGNMLLLARLDP